MQMTRRELAALLAASRLGQAAGLKGLKIGVTDWNLRHGGESRSGRRCEEAGLCRREVSLGRRVTDDKLPLDRPEMIAKYKEAFKEHSFGPAGTCLDVLHVNYLKNDKLGQRWVSDGIRVSKELGAKVMLLPMFGKGALETQAEKDYVGDVLRELGPQAEKAGFALGLENTISAEDNARIMDRSKSKAVLVYYDIGNSTRNGFNVTREIEWLGKKRICQMHFKDNPGYLGEGKIDLKEVVRAVSRIGFEGFANLETDSPSKQVEPDMRRNLAFVKRVIDEVQRT